ncbi:MAG: hypothetical protein ACMUEL_03650 [Flavobacteriales bacterium Tduv]
MLRNTAQLSFSELYMGPFTRRELFFQKLKNLDPLGKDGEKK